MKGEREKDENGNKIGRNIWKRDKNKDKRLKECVARKYFIIS
jgi:hypothetical protein